MTTEVSRLQQHDLTLTSMISFQVEGCLNFSRYTLLPTRSPLPPSTSKLSGQVATAQPPPTPASWKLRVEAESGDRAQRRPPALVALVLSCSLVGPVPLWSHSGPTVVPLSFHSPAVAFLAMCSDLPSLHLACFLMLSASHHALSPQSTNEPILH